MVKIISLLWGFSLGGVGKVAISYGQLEDKSDLKVYTICIQPMNVNVDLSPLNKINSKVILIKNRFDYSWIKLIRTEIDKFNPDKLFVHGFNGPIIGRFLQKFWYQSLPMICSYHGLYHAPIFYKKMWEPLFNKIPVYIYRNYASKVITVANYFKTVLEEQGVPGEIISTIHNGITSNYSLKKVDLSYLRLSNKAIKIGMVGRLDPNKGIEYLIDAILFIKKAGYHNINLIIIGDGPYMHKYKKKVKINKLYNIIHFVGAQSNVSEWLNNIDIFVLPSLMEAHSIALLESMRAGNAIVATNVGGNPESIRDGQDGLLIPPRNVRKLAKAIIKLIESKELRLKLGNSAHLRFLNEFTELRMKKKLKGILTA